MGAAIALRLMSVGHEINVWNRSPGKTAPLVAAGAKAYGTPRDLAAVSDMILTIVTDAPAIDATYDGTQGLLSADIKGKLFVEMSTVRPEIEEALARRV